MPPGNSFSLRDVREEAGGRNPEAGIEVKIMEGCRFLACSLSGLLYWLSYTAQAQIPRDRARDTSHMYHPPKQFLQSLTTGQSD